MPDFAGVENITLDIPLPPTLLEVIQTFEHTMIRDVYQAVQAELETSAVFSRLSPGRRIAVAAGSRGIANLPIIVKAVVDALRRAGHHPFITPAMGSHGGGTAEGQIEMLAALGVTPTAVGAEVQATMEVDVIGQVPGGPRFYQDRVSAAADAVFLVGRVKPHTDFRGPLESGLSKMAVIGLGKRIGAAEMHELGAPGFQRFLVPAARIYEANSNIIGGLAIVENAYDETVELKALSMAEIGGEKEMQLLSLAKKKMGTLAFADIDTLIVRELGKNISGTGLDTNIIGRLAVPRESPWAIPANIAAIAVLSITPESHGNASGMGLANVTTRRFLDQIDWQATYTNALTSGIFGMERDSLPLVMPDDRRAIQAAVRGCGKRPVEARIVFVENTLRLDRLWISPNLEADARQIPHLSITREIPLSFTPTGALCSPWQIEK
jgi:hypothetical protein